MNCYPGAVECIIEKLMAVDRVNDVTNVVSESMFVRVNYFRIDCEQ